jgi:DHA2 family multidrug resistance protein-like MFS transporter
MVVLRAGGIILLPEHRNPTPGRWDPPSVGLSLVGMLGLVYAVKEGAANGLLRVDIAVVGVVGAAALTLFVRGQITLPTPLIDIRLFANHQFSGAVARPEMPSTESRLACVAAAIARGHAGVECSARS